MIDEDDKKAREERIAERRADAVEGLAVLLFALSRASAKPLQPGEAYREAEQFIAESVKRNPRGDVPRGPWT